MVLYKTNIAKSCPKKYFVSELYTLNTHTAFFIICSLYQPVDVSAVETTPV